VLGVIEKNQTCPLGAYGGLRYDLGICFFVCPETDNNEISVNKVLWQENSTKFLQFS
jgi:hypothetical protein